MAMIMEEQVKVFSAVDSLSLKTRIIAWFRQVADEIKIDCVKKHKCATTDGSTIAIVMIFYHKK